MQLADLGGERAAELRVLVQVEVHVIAAPVSRRREDVEELRRDGPDEVMIAEESAVG